MKWYDDYLDAGGVDRDANPTPGNKKGGLANIVEKAMGSIAKSGTAPIEEVLSPAEKPHKRGPVSYTHLGRRRWHAVPDPRLDLRSQAPLPGSLISGFPAIPHIVSETRRGRDGFSLSRPRRLIPRQ